MVKPGHHLAYAGGQSCLTDCLDKQTQNQFQLNTKSTDIDLKSIQTIPHRSKSNPNQPKSTPNDSQSIQIHPNSTPEQIRIDSNRSQVDAFAYQTITFTCSVAIFLYQSGL